MTGYDILIICGAAGFAGLIRGFSGFGSALVMVPLFSLIMPPVTVVPTILTLEVVASLQLLKGALPFASRRHIASISGFAVLGAVPGVYLAGVLDPDMVRWGLSATILFFVLLLSIRLTIPDTRRGLARALAGVASGFAGGIGAINGPPVVACLLGERLEAPVVRATLIVYFLLFDFAVVIAFSALGRFDLHDLMPVAVAFPALVAGNFTGALLFRRFQGHYRVLALGLIAATAVTAPLLAR